MTDSTDDEGTKPMSDQARAFKRYKSETAAHGKPFFPFGVWHDVIAATAVMAIILGLTVVWFAQANCDSWVNVSCPGAATPLEQESNEPLLGPLYEDKADPSTTSYHPRPEWYFYFLFYLLIVFSNPNLVLLGTIGLPTIWLIILLAWPFLDRKRERRPSRRPIAMTAMIVTAAVLLTFTYKGSKAGENEAPAGLTAEQAALPGYKLIYEDPRGQTCFGCHVIVTGSGNVGPDLTNEAKNNRGLEWQIQHLVDPKGSVPGSVMPSQRAAFNDEEIAHLGAFLETLGAPEKATESPYSDATAQTTEQALAGDDS